MPNDALIAILRAAAARAAHTPCECGCGEPTPRRFRPGHDARLKSRLVAAAKAGDLRAARAVLDLGWARFVPMAAWVDLAAREQRRYRGRFVRSVRLEQIETADHPRWIVEAAADTLHSHARCPAIRGRARVRFGHRGDRVDGWVCGVCIHTADMADEAQRQVRDAWLAAEVERGVADGTVDVHEVENPNARRVAGVAERVAAHKAGHATPPPAPRPGGYRIVGGVRVA